MSSADDYNGLESIIDNCSVINNNNNNHKCVNNNSNNRNNNHEQKLISEIPYVLPTTSTVSTGETTIENNICSIEFQKHGYTLLKEMDNEWNNMTDHNRKDSKLLLSTGNNIKITDILETNLNERKMKLSLSQEQLILRNKNELSGGEIVRKSKSEIFSSKFSIFKEKPLFDITIDDNYECVDDYADNGLDNKKSLLKLLTATTTTTTRATKTRTTVNPNANMIVDNERKNNLEIMLSKKNHRQTRSYDRNEVEAFNDDQQSLLTNTTTTEYYVPKLDKNSLLRNSIPNFNGNNNLMSSNEYSIRHNHTPMCNGTGDGVTSADFNTINNYDDTCKCIICKNSFTEPRVLDCLHTFCLNCIIGLNINKLTFGDHQKTIKYNNSDLELSFTGTNALETTLPNSCSELSINEYDRMKNMSIENQKLSKMKSMVSTNKTETKGRQRHSPVNLYPAEKCHKLINCIICGWSTELPFGGVSQLPRNFAVIKKMRNIFHINNNRNLCSLCSDEAMAIVYCLNCAINLCNFCKEAHYRQKHTMTHNIRYIHELKIDNSELQLDDIMKVNTKKNRHYCTIHPNHELKLFCINCCQVSCNNCTILIHRGHKCEPILKASKVYLKSIRDALERTKPLTDFANESIVRLNSYTRKINQRADIVKNEVESFLTQYFEALEVHRNTLLKQIAKAKETKIQICMEQQLELEKCLLEAKRVIKFAEELLQTGSDFEILTLVKILLCRFERCQKTKSILDTNIFDSLQFVPTIRAPSTKAQNNIPIYGIIATQIANPKLCTLETDGLMYLRINNKAELILLSKDNDDRQLCHGGLLIKTELKYKDTLKIVETQVSDKRDGTYIISFIPDAVGLLLLNVIIQDKHIKGSPFTLCVKTLRPHSGVYHCCTFCSSNGSRIATCACESIMTGGYKGCGHGHNGHPGKRHWSCCASILKSSECTVTNIFR